MHPCPAGDLGDVSTRQHRPDRIQLQLNDNQDNQRQSRPPQITGRTTESFGLKVPNQHGVVQLLAGYCRV
jgi:hypothetical protein